ncbi:MAG TPA: PEP-CTERM sorting domain-containing protein [Candidatus Acidoferrales bacterium]|nr:PEP-CTERM sorting domain-containing protein [Candidatus Acidoferrales bacterium]
MCVRTIKVTLFILACLIMMVFGATGASADAVLVGQVNLQGTGFGNVNTILTVQALGTGMGGTESGCVGLNSAGKQIDGPSACQGMNAGGNEKPPDKFPHNQVFKVSDAFTLAVVFNTDQPGGSAITLDNMVLVLYNAQGQVGFTSGNFAKPMSFASTSFQTGIGKAGWEFMLNATQAAQAQAAINAGFDFLGLSATISGASGGPETFFLAGGSGTAPTPEPATLFLLGTGLVLTGVALRRKRKEGAAQL